MRAEAARQQREDRERQKQMEAAYEDKVATLEKEKEQESTEYHEEQLETFQRYRPVEDVTTLVGELLLRDKTSELKDTTGCFVEQIKRRHQTKNLGALNVQYMLDELGLPQEAQMEGCTGLGSSSICSVGGTRKEQRKKPPSARWCSLCA